MTRRDFSERVGLTIAGIVLVLCTWLAWHVEQWRTERAVKEALRRMAEQQQGGR